MAGQLRKDDIIQQKEIQEALAAIAKSVMNVASAFDEVAKSSKAAFESTKKADTIKDLDGASKQSTKNIITQTTAEGKLNEQIKKTNKTLTEKEKLKAKAKQSTQQLELATSKYNKTLQQNRQRIADINKGYKDQVRQGSGLMGMFKNLAKSVAGYALAFVGLTAIIRFFTQTLFKLTKELSALDFAMQTVIKDQDELAVSQNFLRTTAINYGQDIIALTQRYVKFRAASMQSNLTAIETMDIFDSMAKAAGVLGLKTDELNGVFLALEQMISKGKVTTEELRRQLGERLPGAMGIMASSMGVSISKLDKMLKMGEVLSAEVLPNFAKEVERAYGIETVNKIDTLVAAHGRLVTSWKLFVQELSADNAYIKTIERFTNIFSRIRIIGGDVFGDGTELMNKYMLMTNKAGDAVNKMVTELDNAEFSKLQTVEASRQAIKALTDEGITVSHATQLWQEYYNTRESLFNIDKEKNKFSKIFDYEAEKKKLDQAEEDFLAFSKLVNGELKKEFKETSPGLKAANTKNEYLQKMAITARGETELAKIALAEIEKRIENEDISNKLLNANLDKNERQRLIKLQKYLNEESVIRLDNFNNRLAFEIDINNMLYEKEKKGRGGKDETLTLLKNRQKLELAELKKLHAEKINMQTEQGVSEADLLQNQYNHSREVLVQMKEDLEEQFALVSKSGIKIADITKLSEEERLKIIENAAKDSNEYIEASAIERQNIVIEKSNTMLEIETEYQNLLTDIIENAIDFQNGKYEENAKKQEKRRKEESDAIISDLYEQGALLKIQRAAQARDEMKDAGWNVKKKRAIQLNAAIDMLQIDWDTQQKIIESNEATLEEKAKSLEIQKDLEQQFHEDSLNLDVELTKAQIEEWNKRISAMSEISGRVFDIMNTIYDGQLTRIEQLHDYEIAAAGDSVEKRIMAERKYEKEKAKIMRKQAIAQKAQTAFEIIINTASAVVEALPNIPLAVIIGALGLTQLALTLATPIPKFAKGTKNAPETFIAGDSPNSSGASELIMKPDGTAILTPDKPTVFSDKSFVGSTILPADQTQKMLANYAIKQSYDMIDMSESNKQLKQIANNTKNKREVFINKDGRTVIKRGYITSTLV